MRENLLDRMIGYFSPQRGLARERNRLALQVVREYDAARPTRTSGGYRRTGQSARGEASKAHRPLAAGAQDLVRNTALGNRIKAVLASNMVGTGIKLDCLGRSKARTKHYKTTFEAWAESTQCDYEGHLNLYGLQYLWAATIVESGGVLVRKVYNNALAFPLVLQTMEQQQLDATRMYPHTQGNDVLDGIEYTPDGLVAGYWITTDQRKGGRFSVSAFGSKFFPASDIIHIYWKDRPGQHLGVSWYHPVADLINDRQEWRDAALTQMRLAACFGLVVKEPPKEMGLDRAQGALRDADGNDYTEVEPGMIAYADNATDITPVSPPNMNSTGEFNNNVVQDIAVGVNVTREQLTGDFSKVTWASGRLARGEFYTNLDRWQDFMLIPALDKVRGWFDQAYTIKFNPPQVIASWVRPHRSAVNPREELETDIKKVRTCAMTPQAFSAKYGVKFEEAVEAWKQAKAVFGDLPFDHDPSKFSSAGNQLDENDAASSNKKSSSTNQKAGEDE